MPSNLKPLAIAIIFIASIQPSQAQSTPEETLTTESIGTVVDDLVKDLKGLVDRSDNTELEATIKDSGDSILSSIQSVNKTIDNIRSRVSSLTEEKASCSDTVNNTHNKLGEAIIALSSHFAPGGRLKSALSGLNEFSKTQIELLAKPDISNRMGERASKITESWQSRIKELATLGARVDTTYGTLKTTRMSIDSNQHVSIQYCLLRQVDQVLDEIDGVLQQVEGNLGEIEGFATSMRDYN